MLKLGIKIWATNDYYVKPAVELINNGIFEYIELYSVPDSYNDCIKLWQDCKVPFVIHAPHYMQGMNLGDKDNYEKNLKLANEAKKYADSLDAKHIIFHPGMESDIKETARQLKEINDGRCIIENKPYCSIDGKLICNGSHPDDIKFVMDNANVGCCLDFGHATCAANSYKQKPFEFISKFLELNPTMFHLSDGFNSSPIDRHLHYGEGDYDLSRLVSLVPDNSFLSIETKKDSLSHLEDSAMDSLYIRLLEEYSIKDVCSDDCLDVYNLSNHPAVRASSFSSEPIPLETHKKWFTEKLEDTQSTFKIIRSKKDNELVAQVRFNRDKTHAEISISLSEKYWGKGLGTKIIKALSFAYHAKNKLPIVARIKPENFSSAKSFIKSSYQVVSQENMTIMEYRGL